MEIKVKNDNNQRETLEISNIPKCTLQKATTKYSFFSNTNNTNDTNNNSLHSVTLLRLGRVSKLSLLSLCVMLD